MARLPEEFVKWELGASAVDFKVEYVDIAGDLIAGLMLSQIVWSYLPTTKRRLHSKKDEEWLIKGESEWYDECRLSKKRVRRGLETLRKRGLIEVENMPHYRRKNISHIRLNVERFCELWQKFVSPLDCAQETATSSANKSDGGRRPSETPANRSNKSNRAERRPAPRGDEESQGRAVPGLDEVLEALKLINKQLEAMKIKPLTHLPYLAGKIASRGDTVKDMRQAWQESGQNGDSAIAAFVTWITYGKVPAKRKKATTTRINPQTGKKERWQQNGGWVEIR